MKYNSVKTSFEGYKSIFIHFNNNGTSYEVEMLHCCNIHQHGYFGGMSTVARSWSSSSLSSSEITLIPLLLSEPSNSTKFPSQQQLNNRLTKVDLV